jgi:hypothetical protein
MYILTSITQKVIYIYIYIYIYIHTAYEHAVIARIAPTQYLFIITFNLRPFYLLLFIKKRN